MVAQPGDVPVRAEGVGDGRRRVEEGQLVGVLASGGGEHRRRYAQAGQLLHQLPEEVELEEEPEESFWVGGVVVAGGGGGGGGSGGIAVISSVAQADQPTGQLAADERLLGAAGALLFVEKDQRRTDQIEQVGDEEVFVGLKGRKIRNIGYLGSIVSVVRTIRTVRRMSPMSGTERCGLL